MVFIPVEIYELTEKVSVLRVLTFLINVAIVAYLLFAKRLFGLRGGHAKVKELRHELSGVGGRRTGPPRPRGSPAEGPVPGGRGVGHRGHRNPGCRWYCPCVGPLAQLVAHLHDTQGVVGSSPARRTKSFRQNSSTTTTEPPVVEGHHRVSL